MTGCEAQNIIVSVSKYMVKGCAAQKTRGAQQTTLYFIGIKKTPF